MNDLRLLLRLLGVSVRAQTQYRASFAMLAIGQMLTSGADFLGLWAVFARFGSLRGWTMAEVGLLYGMVHVAFAFAEAAGRGFDLFPGMVRTGEFDRMLLRPRGTALQIAGLELQLMRIGRLAQGLAVLIWAMASVGVTWTAAKAALVIAGIASGAAIFYGLFVLQATAAFWTVETLELMNTVTYGGTEAASYPLTIYRPWFRRFFTFVVPLACINLLPAGIILNRGGVAPGPLTAVAPAAGLLFLWVALSVWRLGERRYLSTGS